MADKIPRPHKASVTMTARELAAVKALGEIWEHDKASTFRRAVREALAAELNRRVGSPPGRPTELAQIEARERPILDVGDG